MLWEADVMSCICDVWCRPGTYGVWRQLQTPCRSQVLAGRERQAELPWPTAPSAGQRSERSQCKPVKAISQLKSSASQKSRSSGSHWMDQTWLVVWLKGSRQPVNLWYNYRQSSSVTVSLSVITRAHSLRGKIRQIPRQIWSIPRLRRWNSAAQLNHESTNQIHVRIH